MQLYDISQELFSAEVYPGDPAPTLTRISSMTEGDLYNLSAFSACAHNGTHVDAPSHFINGAKTVSELDLNKTVGKAYVAEAKGVISKNEAVAIISRAKAKSAETAQKILIKGDATVSKECAEVFLAAGVHLIGSETQSVGPIDAPMEVHKILLGGEVILLEGIRLGEVSEGEYFLFAAPINLGALEGAPCRAVLVDFEK